MDSINYSFNDIQDMSPEDVDTIMSFIPEASFKLMSIGTPCIGKDGKTVCSLGVIKTKEENVKPMNEPMFPKTEI